MIKKCELSPMIKRIILIQSQQRLYFSMFVRKYLHKKRLNILRRFYQNHETICVNGLRSRYRKHRKLCDSYVILTSAHFKGHIKNNLENDSRLYIFLVCTHLLLSLFTHSGYISILMRSVSKQSVFSCFFFYFSRHFVIGYEMLHGIVKLKLLFTQD